MVRRYVNFDTDEILDDLELTLRRADQPAEG
jgi:hypothetical protein